LTRKRVVPGLVAVLVGDAVFDTVAVDWIRNDLERLQLPYELHHVFPVVKTAAAAGLVVGGRWTGLARFTARALVAYFILALVAHARVRDEWWRYAPAAGMLLWARRALSVLVVPGPT